mgnify:CR=1 FL=1
MTRTFSGGNPAEAWEVSQALLQFSSELVVEASRTRFKLNFGSNQCRNCTGLKAGPGVVATCYQVQQCYYSNIREDDLNPRLARIADLLGKKS